MLAEHLLCVCKRTVLLHTLQHNHAEITYNIITQTYSIDTNDVSVLGDGTSSNVGWNDSSMAHMEKKPCRSCQRVVCLLHHVELPFRKLFECLDGTTSRPKSFTGPIGK